MSIKQDHTHNVIEAVNEDFFNWLPLLELLSISIEPEVVAKDLLSVHFHLTRYIVNNPEEIDLTASEIRTLQELYIALTKLTKKDTALDGVKIQFIPNNPENNFPT